MSPETRMKTMTMSHISMLIPTTREASSSRQRWDRVTKSKGCITSYVFMYDALSTRGGDHSEVMWGTTIAAGPVCPVQGPWYRYPHASPPLLHTCLRSKKSLCVTMFGQKAWKKQ